MKIGIMGGTFDPIHNGHLMLGNYAYKLFRLDQVWFLPNGNPPHKSSAAIESMTVNRVEMVQKAIQPYAYFRLEKYEVEGKEISYSYQTMQYFQDRYPEHEFYFIIGADSLFSIEKMGTSGEIAENLYPFSGISQWQRNTGDAKSDSLFSKKI